MGNRPAPVEIRQPRIVRIYLIGFSIVWCGFLVVIIALTHSGASVVPALMLVFGALLFSRLLRLGVVADDTGLLVRNNYRTKHYAWSDVEGFRVGGAMGGAWGKGIYVLLRNGEVVVLEATRRVAGLGRGAERLDGYLAALRAWLPPGGP